MCKSFVLVKEFLKDRGTNKRIALVTDHAAIAFAQRNWRTGFGGFSFSYYLNLFFSKGYDEGWSAEVFYVQGTLNPADGPSRSPSFLFTATETEFAFPNLRSFYHPFASDQETEEYMV